MKPTCINCKFYSQAQHVTDITCAINPEGKAKNCLDYSPIVLDNALETALINLKQAEYDAFRQQALNKFGVPMPDLSFNSDWFIPESSINCIKEFLPKVVTHQKAQGYTQEQIIIAVIKWVEKRINLYLDDYDLESQGLSEYGLWHLLPSLESESD